MKRNPIVMVIPGSHSRWHNSRTEKYILGLGLGTPGQYPQGHCPGRDWYSNVVTGCSNGQWRVRAGLIRYHSIAISVLQGISNTVWNLNCEFASNSDKLSWLRQVPNVISAPKEADWLLYCTSTYPDVVEGAWLIKTVQDWGLGATWEKKMVW